jgi:hypothetical protein
MALADVATNLGPSGVPWRTCATCHALSEMSAKDAKILRGLLADRSVKFKDLAKALAGDPDSPTISWESLSRHARAGCAANEQLR